LQRNGIGPPESVMDTVSWMVAFGLGRQCGALS
jgi:hypothetical protein